MTAEPVTVIVERHAGSRGGLIAIRQDIQARYGYLPADALKAVAEKTGRPLVDIYVATFYHAFSLEPRGKHVCSVCLGTACHARGGPVIAGEFQRVLEVQPGQTTGDREFAFETVNCLGACHTDASPPRARNLYRCSDYRRLGLPVLPSASRRIHALVSGHSASGSWAQCGLPPPTSLTL